MPHVDVDGDDYTFDAPTYDCRTLTEKVEELTKIVKALTDDHITAQLEASLRMANIEDRVHQLLGRVENAERKLRGRGPVA